MATEVWFRNPKLYIRQLALHGQDKIVWLRGDLVKKRIEPVHYIKGTYGPSRAWRCLVIATTGAHEYTEKSRDETDFAACYPVWQYGEPLQTLEILASENCANDPASWDDATIDPFYRPKPDQEHRIVVMDLPPSTSGAGRRFLSDVGEIQESFPDAIIHLTGCWAYSVAFGYGTRSCDLDPHFMTSKNKLVLPNGREIKSENVGQNKMWAHVIGHSAMAEEYEDMDKVLKFNIDSANWAGKFYADNEKFRVRNNITKNEFVPPQSQSHWTSHKLPALQSVDMVTCDTCSRKDNCKYYRAAAICSVPGANVSELAKHFRTRDSDTIIDALGALVALEADRIQEGRENEVEAGNLDPHVTAAINSAFNHGEKLAKLIDPKLRSPKLAVQVNNIGQGDATNLRVLAAEAVKTLEASGIPRSEQSTEMIMKAIGAAAPVLEGRVVEDGSLPR